MPLEHRVLSAGDKVHRRRLSLTEPGGAKNETLMSIYRHWESLRHEGRPPKRSAFDIQQLRPVMGMTCVVDVAAEHPDDYFVRLFGSDIPLGTNMSKHRLGDYPSQPYRDMLAEDYKTARDLGTALYHEIAARIDYKRHSYARLILPFADDGGRVNQLIICSAQQTFDDLLQYLD